MIKSKSGNQNIAVADQEFPRRGRRSDPKDESASLLFGNFFPENCMTRMHSSRMRTARSCSCLRGGGLSASVHAGIHPLWAWVWTSPGVGLDTHPTPPWVWAWTPPWCQSGPPQPDPPTSPLGVGLDTTLVRPPNLPPGPGPRHPPLWTE